MLHPRSLSQDTDRTLSARASDGGRLIPPPDLGRSVPAERPTRSWFGLSARELRRDERILHHWRARRGRGLLTNQRLFLLGHPAPIHRPILWSVDLEKITELEVIQPSFPQARQVQTQVIGSKMGELGAAGGAGSVQVDALFIVLADAVPVFSGGPDGAERIQRWIIESRDV
jgi:hypothetical protein